MKSWRLPMPVTSPRSLGLRLKPPLHQQMNVLTAVALATARAARHTLADLT
jgi:hypothetical protein